MRGSRLLWVVVLFQPAVGEAIMLGQVDGFQDGTMNGWQSSASPANIADGGPAGVGDRYLRLTSTGGTGADGYLYASNAQQWAGDYVASGVTALEMDLRNYGTADLQIRVLVFSQKYGDFTSTTAFTLPVDGAWHRAVFGLTASDLTWIGGGLGDLAGTLSHSLSLAIRHQAGPPQGPRLGTPVASQLGIDSIRAVPEPATLTLVPLAATILQHRHGCFVCSASLGIGGAL